MKRLEPRTVPIPPASQEVTEKWIIYRLIEQKPKTQVWDVLSRCDSSPLGVIKWYSAWRHYCFIISNRMVLDETELVFSDRCLQSIKDFVSKLNDAHKQERRLREQK